MRALVTGWAGYLGSPIIRRLRAAGWHVTGLDTGWFLSEFAAMPVFPDVALFRDLRNSAPYGIYDAVVHLAGLSNDPLAEIHPALTHQINVRGTLDLLGMRGPKHVVVSSCAVYGRADMADEETVPRPMSAYAEAKVKVDKSLLAGACSLRLGTAWGYAPGFRADLVVNAWARAAVIEVFGNAARPYIHVDDVADAVLFALEHDLQGIYNVAAENWRTEALAELFDKPKGRRDVWDHRSYSVSTLKMQAAGFSPGRFIEDGIAALVALQLPPREYRRLAALRGLVASGRLTDDLWPSGELAPVLLPSAASENRKETDAR